MDMYSIHLFAGAGAGILAGTLDGLVPIGACEIEEYPRKVLLQRQLDGIFPVFPIWDDVKTLRFDNPDCATTMHLWRTVRQNLVICGGFPCQDISAAGKGAGITGDRSGLWSEFARIIGEVRPRFAFVENSPMLTIRGLGRVLGDLAALGYDAEWGVLGAENAILVSGSPCAYHRRQRIWIVGMANAYNTRNRTSAGRINDHGEEKVEIRGEFTFSRTSGRGEAIPHTNCGRCEQCHAGERSISVVDSLGQTTWWDTDPGDDAESGMGRMANGVANRNDRIRAIGNGQVPRVAQIAWNILMSRINTTCLRPQSCIDAARKEKRDDKE